MWNSKKSVLLSIVCTRIVMILTVICAAAMPYWLDYYMDVGIVSEEQSARVWLLTVIYICIVIAITALICLDRLLSNIKKEKIFIERNVRFLRVISWCCFALAAALIPVYRYYVLFVFVSVAAAFMGLILRVVKNVIQEAVIIKTENDFTI